MSTNTEVPLLILKTKDSCTVIAETVIYTLDANSFKIPSVKMPTISGGTKETTNSSDGTLTL